MNGISVFFPNALVLDFVCHSSLYMQTSTSSFLHRGEGREDVCTQVTFLQKIESCLQKPVEETLAYYTLLHFIVYKLFVFSFVLRRITLHYTLAITLCFTGFCERIYSKLLFVFICN